MKHHPIANVLMLAGLLSLGPAAVAGVQPEAAVLWVNADDGEAIISIKNTDSLPIMLLTKIEPIGEDKRKLLSVMPPLARVEGHSSKPVRFVLTGDRDFSTQRLQRIYFAGLPINTRVGNNIDVGGGLNLPVIINPKGLAMKRDPWTLLQWRVVNHQLAVKNASPYVVCLAQTVIASPGDHKWLLPRGYVLPGEQLLLPANNQASLDGVSRITLYPVAIDGYAVDSYTADVDQ
ncbi:fimbria/pilus chaperone family protein [Serratia proteamaculans]|uniref:fimbria/pilus chaperone family protein n=1 Tax=Serratia proteamaculans TaxID=28151 RepID=UPI00217A9E33|nr:fimbria/pilus chaperone family protein [Serratia proteamaculans]CAI1615209.1 putative fimbrial chaperone protein [Serratia proteamaculans]